MKIQSASEIHRECVHLISLEPPAH